MVLDPGRNTLQYMHHNSELENVLIQTFSMSIFGRLLLFFLSILQYFQTTTILFVGINHLRPGLLDIQRLLNIFKLMPDILTRQAG